MHHRLLSRTGKFLFFLLMFNLLVVAQIQAADRCVLGEIFGRDG